MRLPQHLRVGPIEVPDAGWIQGQWIELTCADGSSGLLWQNSEGRQVHLHGYLNPKAESLAQAASQGDLLLLGVGLGYAWDAVCQVDIQERNIVVVEPCPHVAAQLRQRWSPHVLVLDRDSQTSDWARAREMCAQAQVVRHAPTWSVAQRWLEAAWDTLKPQPSPQKFTAWTDLALLFGAHFLLPELAECLPAGEHWNWDRIRSPQQLEHELNQWIELRKPVWVLAVNMKGIDPLGIVCEVLRRAGVRLAVWFVDDPAPILSTYPTGSYQIDLALTWDASYVLSLQQDWGARRVEVLPLATSRSRWETGKVIPEPRESQSVAFVGGAMAWESLQALKMRTVWDPAWDRLAEDCAQHLVQDRRWDVHEILKPLFGNNPSSKYMAQSAWLAAWVKHRASGIQRAQLIQESEALNLWTYGDPKAWREVRASDVRVQPDVDYRTQLPQIYQQHGVHLNQTSLQMPRTVNQRVFDVPACGGFLVTDAPADMGTFFESGVEMAVAQTRTEREYWIRKAWTEPGLRQEMIRQARVRIAEEHCYEHRLATLRKWL
jgi:spore maturation protein CgeB